MKSILVTGGAGYIGSHTAKALARAGYTPVVLDNLSTGHRWAVKWGPLVKGDVADRALVRRTLENYRIEAVLHFAANASVAESMEHPRKYLYNNVAGSLELLEAMHEAGVRHIVFSSTCATYGIPADIPIPENAPQAPVNPYGESKLFIERALEWYGRSYDFSWAVLRYFNAAGADPEGELGEEHNPETHLIPLVIQAALGRRPVVDVMGTGYATPDGTAIRDYIHVSDLAAAHLSAIKYLQCGGESAAFNLGTSRGYSVREVIGAVERLAGWRVAARSCPPRPGDPPILVARTERAKTELGWKPRYINLDAIVRTAWNWHVARAAGRTAAAAV